MSSRFIPGTWLNFWDNPICSIIHDEAHHCIIVVWKQYATQIQLRYIHENPLTLTDGSTQTAA